MENATSLEELLVADAKTAFRETSANLSGIPLESLLGPKHGNLYVVVPMTIIYVIIFITGLVGNISTCVVISKNKSMHTATNYYLFSLAISDLVLLVSGLPQEMYSIWSRYPYIFGQTFCVLRGLFSETSANATVLTITAFTVERYLAICHPFLSHTMSKLSRAIKFILSIWVISICFAMPQALQFKVIFLIKGVPDSLSCQVAQTIIPHSFEFSTFVFFVGPMSLITVLYALIAIRLRSSNRLKKSTSELPRGTSLLRSRCGHGGIAGGGLKPRRGTSSKRVLKMLVAVVVAFFVCWAPFHVQRLVAIYGTLPTNHEEKRRFLKIYEIVTYISGVLYYVSTTINPLLYNIMSNKFRDAFKETFARCCGLPCVAAKHPQRTYSILSRSLRRRYDSTTDSTSRDYPSVQTNVTYAKKNSQDPVDALPASCRRGVSRSSWKSAGSFRTDALSSSHRQRSEDGAELERANSFGGATAAARGKSPWRRIFGLGGRYRDARRPNKFTSPIAGSVCNIVEAQNLTNKLSTSCDISNSSLKDTESAVLRDELSKYLSLVAYQHEI